MAAVDPKFWCGKRVLLTGHTGFKGSWAAIWLSAMGARVTGFARRPDHQPNLFELARVRSEVDSVYLDLRDAHGVDEAPAGRAFDLVLHMAAQPIVRTSVADPISTFDTNIMGTAHLLQMLRVRALLGLQAVLVVTSDKVYANAGSGGAFGETDPLGGIDPYSASKAAAEIVTQSFAKSFFEPHGVPVATARAGNVIGGGDFSHDRLVPDMVRAAWERRTVVLRHPESTRPWQHVLDCVAGYLIYMQALATDSETPRALNFGPKRGCPEVSVGELADMGVKALGAQPWRHEREAHSIEAKSLAIDASLAKQSLGFESRLDAPQAMSLTMEWYRRYANGEDAFVLCREQIKAYEELV